MKKIPFVVLIGAFALAPLFAGASRDSGTQGSGGAQGAALYTVTVAGSTSVNTLMELLVVEYRKQHDNVSCNISATGSGDGIKSVPAETVEIGMSSRELSAAEFQEESV